jgi:hypothetical protein
MGPFSAVMSTVAKLIVTMGGGRSMSVNCQAKKEMVK